MRARAVPFEYIISLRNQQVYAHLHLAEQACICHSSRMLFHKQFTYIGLHLFLRVVAPEIILSLVARIQC